LSAPTGNQIYGLPANPFSPSSGATLAPANGPLKTVTSFHDVFMALFTPSQSWNHTKSQRDNQHELHSNCLGPDH